MSHTDRSDDALVSTSEEDFLDQDPAVRNQNYVCLSFLSPEAVIKRKEAYLFEKFLKSFAEDMSEFVGKLEERYPEDAELFFNIRERYSYVFDATQIENEYQHFLDTRGSELEKAYYVDNKFQTNIRGIKVRGTFDTQKEAEIRAQVLKRMDNKFHVYVAQVGCWCPWDPNPDDIESQEYTEVRLNTLMKKYKENQEKKDAFFQERKAELQFRQPKQAAAATPRPPDLPETAEEDAPAPAPALSASEIMSSMQTADM